MRPLGFVESVLQAVVEGSFRRLFSPRLQPVEVARALDRVMESERVVAAASVDVPNHYVAHLNPIDFERFASFRGGVERDAAAYLDRRAAEGDFRPIGRIRVELVADPNVPRSFVRCQATFEDPPEPAAPEEIEHTRRLEPVVVARRGHAAVVLAGEDGQELRLDAGSVTIGRGIENDFVVPDIRVSRNHAVIEPGRDGWIVRDLQSTNGTYVQGKRVRQARIGPGAELSLGGYRLSLRRPG